VPVSGGSGNPRAPHGSGGKLRDVAPDMAARVRTRLFTELEDPSTLGAGAHYPQLQFGRLLTGQGRRWISA
jgi:hypothetical protein